MLFLLVSGVSFSPPRKLLLKCVRDQASKASWPVPRSKTHARESQSTDQMPRWWVLSVLLAGSGATAAAKMPPKPAAHRPAFILSQEKPEQPPKLAATDVAPAVVKVGRLRGGGVPWRPRRPDTDLVGTACMYTLPPAMLLLMTAVYYLLRTTGPHRPFYELPSYLALMHYLITCAWFLIAFLMWIQLTFFTKTKLYKDWLSEE